MLMLVRISSSRHGLQVFSIRTSLLTILSEVLLFAPQVGNFSFKHEYLFHTHIGHTAERMTQFHFVSAFCYYGLQQFHVFLQ